LYVATPSISAMISFTLSSTGSKRKVFFSKRIQKKVFFGEFSFGFLRGYISSAKSIQMYSACILMFLMLVGVNSQNRTYYKQILPTLLVNYHFGGSSLDASTATCTSVCERLGWSANDNDGCKEWFTTSNLFQRSLLYAPPQNDVAYITASSFRQGGYDFPLEGEPLRLSIFYFSQQCRVKYDVGPWEDLSGEYGKIVTACVCKKTCPVNTYLVTDPCIICVGGLGSSSTCQQCTGVVEAAYTNAQKEYVPETCVTKEKLKERYNELQVCTRL